MAQMISFWRYIHAVCRTDACCAAKRQVCREKLWNAAFLWDCTLYWPVNMAAYLQINRWGSYTICWWSEEQHRLQHQHQCLSRLCLRINSLYIRPIQEEQRSVHKSNLHWLVLFSCFQQLSIIWIPSDPNQQQIDMTLKKRVFLGDVFLSQFKAFCIRLYRGTDLFWNMNYDFKKPSFTINQYSTCTKGHLMALWYFIFQFLGKNY